MSIRRFVQCGLCLGAVLFAMEAAAWIRSPATSFAELPAGTAFPEGITVDTQGNVYVADLDFSKASGPGNVVVFNAAGKHLRTLDVQGSSALLLGLAFQPHTNALLVLDLGNSNVLKVDPLTGASSVFAALPAGAGPNALTFDPSGDVYVSDSFLATIWRIPAAGGAAAVWTSDPLLGTSGIPPFGANGIAFNNAHTAMFVANTGNDTIIRIPVQAGFVAGPPGVFVYSINGADGLIIDAADNLWVAANQADEIVVLNPTGRVIAKLGDFEGIDPRGAPRGLLFPASLVFSDGFVYVTNLSLDFGAPTVDSQWAASVKRYNIARIRAQIPPVR